VDGKEGETIVLQTADRAAKIRLLPDRTRVSANGQDLSCIGVEITDKDGTLQPNAQNQLQFSLDGPGVIAGVDNANITDTDPYVGKSRSAWHGRALVVVRSMAKAGRITLKASSQGLTEASVDITAE